MAFLSSEIEYGSCLWTYAASTEAEPGHLFSLSPSAWLLSLAMAFLSSEKDLDLEKIFSKYFREYGTRL